METIVCEDEEVVVGNILVEEHVFDEELIFVDDDHVVVDGGYRVPVASEVLKRDEAVFIVDVVDIPQINVGIKQSH